jgi:ketosteroid isomerase-like protein
MIRDLESQWSAAAGAKDLDKTVSFYADDATVLPANAPIATTKQAIRALWKGLFDSPGLAISWKTAKVEVAKSGEMAYATGTYELTMNDATGKPMTDHGKYVTVWEKIGGSWKCGADIWNSDLPATPAEAAQNK